MARGGVGAALVLALMGAGCGAPEKGSEAPGEPAAAVPQDLELARVGEQVITFGQVQAFYSGMPDYLQSEAVGLEKGRNHLQTLIDMELLRLEAVEQGIDRQPAFLQKMKSYQKERLVGLYQVRKIRVRIGEQEVRDYFAQQKLAHRVRFAQIIAADSESAAAALRELAAGQSFEEVAEKYSTHEETASKGGDSGKYVGRLDVPPTLREMLFSLKKGEVSDAVDLGGRVGIFKTLDQAEVGLDEEQFRAAYQALFIERSVRERAALADSLKAVYALERDERGLDAFVAAMRRGASPEEEGVRSLVLYRYTGGQVYAGDLLDAVSKLKYVALDLQNRDEVAGYAERNLVAEELFLKAALEEGLDREGEIARWLERKRDQELVVQLRVAILQERISITDEEVLQHYQENPERYMRPEQIEVQEILVASEQEAQALLERVRRGESMGALARQHSLRPLGQRDEEGRLRFALTTRPLYGHLAAEARKVPVGELGGPVHVAEGYTIFKVLSREQERAPFEEVRRRAWATVNWIKKQREFEAYLAELRGRYGEQVEIREDNLRRAFAAL